MHKKWNWPRNMAKIKQSKNFTQLFPDLVKIPHYLAGYFDPLLKLPVGPLGLEGGLKRGSYNEKGALRGLKGNLRREEGSC